MFIYFFEDSMLSYLNLLCYLERKSQIFRAQSGRVERIVLPQHGSTLRTEESHAGG